MLSLLSSAEFARARKLSEQRIRQLVYAFYEREFSFSRFVRDHADYRNHLIRILIGDVFNDEVGELFDVMGRYIDLPEEIELEKS
jgi:hypothetical protein